MCGYIFLRSNNKKDHKLIKRNIARIERRGPDETNLVQLENKTMIHTRLSIVDLDYGQQPMNISNNNNSYWIIFNGEIYNYLELRKELSKDYIFKTNSDTEVLLASYIVWGESCLQKINGMYSFLIISNKNEDIFCARDITGQKPLYYSFKEDKILISSIPIRFDQKKII